MGNRDSVFRFPDGKATGRQEAARLLDALRHAANARKVLKVIFDAIWPAELLKPLESVVISMDDLKERTKLSKGTISPQLTHLKAAGWVETEGRGNVYRINWSQLFDLDQSRPVQPVQVKMDQLDRTLDRSNSDLDRLDRCQGEKLDRFGPVQTGPNDALDAFSPLERLLNANEEMTSVLFEILDRLETVEQMRSVVEKLDRSIELLDRLDRSNQSNRSKHAPCTCMECKNVIHDMSWGDFEDSEKTPADAVAVSESQPVSQDASPAAEKPTSQEASPMVDPKDFKWPDDLYEPGKGLLPACFDMATGRERLWQAVCAAGVWPRDARGHQEFIATVIYCKRTADKPGAALTAAVRGAHYGPRARFQKQDLQDANATIGRAAPPPKALPRRKEPAAERDWSDIDQQLADMDRDQRLELLASDFHRRRYLTEVGRGKDPLQDSFLLGGLRKGLLLRL